MKPKIIEALQTLLELAAVFFTLLLAVLAVYLSSAFPDFHYDSRMTFFAYWYSQSLAALEWKEAYEQSHPYVSRFPFIDPAEPDAERIARYNKLVAQQFLMVQ